MKLMKNEAVAVPVRGLGGGSRQLLVATRRWLMFLTACCCCLLALSSCGVYSFSGNNLPENIKTVTINNFTLQTAGGPANLPQNLTERLKEYYQRNTNLKVISTGGDMALEGTITGYDLIAVAAAANDQAALNRLQITVQVRFTNTKDDTKSFDQPFSFYKDFPQNQTLSQNEATLVPQILDQLVLDVFSKTAADW